MRQRTSPQIALAFLLVALSIMPSLADDQRPQPIRVLFLGDRGPHQPADRFAQLQPAMAQRGIQLSYTDQVAALDQKRLAGFDALLIYANIERIEPEQEQALLD